MQTNNFPPCPMCRKKITVSISHLDPGIAEQTIVDLVKQYETCDICRYKSNPNLRCENCCVYVCDNCLPCHNTLKPSHKVVPIIPKRDSSKVPMKLTRTCTDHEDQPLDLYCIICYRILCIHCKKYSHAQCNERVGLERERYRQGFLNYYFMNSSKDRQITYGKNELKRIVYIKDFANAARQWLKPIQTELKSCIKFFEECKTKIENVGKEKNECCDFQERFHKFIDEIGNTLEFGHNVYFRTETLLQESTVDADVAVNVLRIEEDCLMIFRQRQRQAGCKLFVDVETTSGHIRSNNRQSCKCVVTEFPASCASIMALSHYTQLHAGESKANEASAAKLNNSLLTCLFAKSEHNYSNDVEKRDCKTDRWSICRVGCIVNCLYQNEALDKYELTNHGVHVDKYGRDIYVDVIGNGNICDEPNPTHCHDSFVTYDDFQVQIRIRISRRWYQINIQRCANLVSYPIHFNLLGSSLYTQRESLWHVRDKCEYVTHIVCNSECGNGLQSFFLYTELSELPPERDQPILKGMRAISISTNVAKFNKYIHPVNISDSSYQRHCSKFLKDEQNAFIVAKCLDKHTKKGFMSYRTVSTLAKEHNQITLMLSEDLSSRPVATTGKGRN